MNEDIEDIKTPFAQYLFSAGFMFLIITTCLITKQQDLLGVLLGLPLILGAILPRRSTYRMLFYYFCMSFLIGQRTIYITPVIRVYPPELIVIFLSFLLFVFGKRAGFVSRHIEISRAFKVFAMFCILAIYMGYHHAGQHGYGLMEFMTQRSALELGLYYTKGLLMLIPIFYCVNKLVDTRREFVNLAGLLAVIALMISANCVAERYGVGLTTLLGGELSREAVTTEVTGFSRSYNSWAGGPLITGVVCLFIGVLFGLQQQFAGKRFAKIIIIVQVLCILTVVFGGHRSIWVQLVLMLLLLFWLRGSKRMCLLVILCLVGIATIPNAMMARFQGLYAEQQDSSTVKRIERIEYAWSLVRERPLLGHGWGASGLVHSDFLQIAADAGLLALFVFLVLCFRVLKDLYVAFKTARDPTARAYAIGLFVGLGAYLNMFLTQAHFNTQEVLIIFWFFFALGTVFQRVIYEH